MVGGVARVQSCGSVLVLVAECCRTRLRDFLIEATACLSHQDTTVVIVAGAKSEKLPS